MAYKKLAVGDQVVVKLVGDAHISYRPGRDGWLRGHISHIYDSGTLAIVLEGFMIQIVVDNMPRHRRHWGGIVIKYVGDK